MTSRRDKTAVKKTYVPTGRESEALTAFQSRIQARPLMPKFAANLEGRVERIEVEHDDTAVGWDLVAASLGSTDRAFSGLMIAQLAAVSEGSPAGPVDNDLLAGQLGMAQGLEPRDELEGALAVQMAAVHSATMRMAERLRSATSVELLECYERALNRLARTFAAQVEALKRYRSKGDQKVVVEHVHVHEGGRAVIGNVGGGVTR